MCCESDLFQRSHSADDEVTKNATHMTATTDAAVSLHPHASICSLEVFHCRTALLWSLYKSVPLTWQESVWLASNMLDICYALTHAHLSSLLHWSVHHQPVNWTSTIQYIYSMCPSLKANCKTKTSFHFPLWGKYLILAVIPEGILYWLHLLPAGSAYFSSHNLAYCIIGTTLLSVCPSFLSMTVLWVDRAVISSNGSNAQKLLSIEDDTY